MSEETASTRKEKKALRDADRKKQGKKRKHGKIEDESEPQAIDELKQDFIPLGVDVEENDPKAKSVASQEDGAPKSKKRRKSKAQSTEHADGEQSTTKPRFIVFVGNLPYSTTDASLQTHFKKLAPFKLRHRTDPKKKNKSKGFAFLEFENYDRMKTCLKLYHHSIFDPDKTNAGVEEEEEAATEGASINKKKSKGARRINVELTAGGGGKAEGRKEKIKQKNLKLEEQRKRVADAQKQEKVHKKQNDGGSKTKPVAGSAPTKAEFTGASDTADVHPSRLSRIKG